MLIQFLDGCLSCVDTLNKVAMIDELLNDLVIILCLLIDTVCLCSKWMLENPTDSDDRVVFNEGMIKSLSTAELFVTIRGSKACLQDLLQKDDNPCIKYVTLILNHVIKSSNFRFPNLMIEQSLRPSIKLKTFHSNSR